MKYLIVLSRHAERQLDNLSARNRKRVTASMQSLLKDHPLSESKNCKRMRENPLATWRLKVGEFRVYFDVADEERHVYIQAIGMKIGNRVLIDGEEMEL